MAQVLLVENDPRQRQFYCAALQKEGYEVVDVATGAEALKVLAHQEIDAVILEVLLPDIYGMKLMDQILAAKRHLPIIINTDCIYLRSDMKSWAADAFVTKSSDPSELMHALAGVTQAKNAPKKQTISRAETKGDPVSQEAIIMKILHDRQVRRHRHQHIRIHTRLGH